MKSIDMFIDWLEGEVGYLEKKSNAQLDDKTANVGNKNFTKYARDLDAVSYYNGRKNGYSWCCVLPDCGRFHLFGMETALKMVGQKQGGLGAGVKYMAQYYKAIGRLFNDPQRGDQVILVSRNNKGEVTGWLHTGIVTEVKNGRIYTIEGNTSASSGVVSNGGGVFKKSYSINSKSIYGYGRPLWDLAEKALEKRNEEVIDMTKDEVVKLIDEKVFLQSFNCRINLSPVVYKTANNIPDWAIDTVDKLVAEGKLKGDEHGDLNISQDLLRALVIMNR